MITHAAASAGQDRRRLSIDRRYHPILVTIALIAAASPVSGQSATSSTGRFADPPLSITAADCTSARLGSSIAPTDIGEPVASVTLAEPRWVLQEGALPARCEVDGRMGAIDQSGMTPPINFRVWLPQAWNRRTAQQGGSGNNGVIPDLRGAQYSIEGRSLADWGFVTYGSDSGHQAAPGRRGGPPPSGSPATAGREGNASPRGAQPSSAAGPGPPTDVWALSDEAIKNLGYMQMKKTRDAAMVLIQRAYGERPRFNYYTGTSQGGREALTVAQRYPADYDGVVANVPIVSFSSLMLAPELIRIEEKALARQVTRTKVNAIRAEFLRQCDHLDGLTDGVINNYVGCRAIFDVKQGGANRRPWAARRCPGNVDPDPSDTTAAACLTDGQIATLEFVYSRYRFATPLANRVRAFGMWLPNTDPSGSGLIADRRFKGQEGAGADAAPHTHLGVLGVTGFLMQDVSANPLDYEEGGRWNRRREELSAILDATNPDLRPFARRGGKMIVTIGTDDTLASPGAQLDYYQAVLDKLGRRAVDAFARFFVIPQANHGLMARTAPIDGGGKPVESVALPTGYERFAVLVDWVERRITPGKSLTLSGGGRTFPLCSYPQYPRYSAGPVSEAGSYRCADR